MAKKGGTNLSHTCMHRTHLVVHDVRNILKLEQSPVLALCDRKRLLGHERREQLLQRAV